MCLGIPGQIVEILDHELQTAVAEISGVRREVNVACVAEGPLDVLVGKWVLVHVGFAMALIDEAEAARTLEALHSLGEAQETLDAIRQGARTLGEAP